MRFISSHILISVQVIFSHGKDGGTVAGFVILLSLISKNGGLKAEDSYTCEC